MAGLPITRTPPQNLRAALMGARAPVSPVNAAGPSQAPPTMQRSALRPPLPTDQRAPIRGQQPAAPAPPAVNPYTGQPLGPNEYVGVAGSEAEHPGQTRIPPPGWWDPSNANYERRDYYIGPDGNIVANEAGFQANPDHPFDTGRPGERNSEFAGRGYQHVSMSQPGVNPWGPGGEVSYAALPGGGNQPPGPPPTNGGPGAADSFMTALQDQRAKLRGRGRPNPGDDLAVALAKLQPGA